MALEITRFTKIRTNRKNLMEGKIMKSEHLTKKQKAVLDDLFSGTFTTQEVFEKWKVSRRTYYGWHNQECFSVEFNRLMILAQNVPDLVFARYASNVAERLVGLTVCEKEETARKACMDVITHPDLKAKLRSKIKIEPKEEPHPEISEELATKILTVLADHEESTEQAAVTP
jgi:predicted DNA-binding protein YlxM (UPF0122 family)